MAPKKIGRPLKNPPAGAAERIEKWARDGISKESIAAGLRVAPETLNRWLAEFPALGEAFARSRAGLESEMASIVVTAARGGDVRAAQWILEYTCGRKRGESVHIGVGGNLNVLNFPSPPSMKDFLDAHGHGQSIDRLQSLPNAGLVRPTERS